jgi:hypothetical protein
MIADISAWNFTYPVGVNATTHYRNSSSLPFIEAKRFLSLQKLKAIK